MHRKASMQKHWQCGKMCSGSEWQHLALTTRTWPPLRYLKFDMFFFYKKDSFLQENIASVRADQGNLTEAMELYQEVLRVRVATLGPEHPVVADTQVPQI